MGWRAILDLMPCADAGPDPGGRGTPAVDPETRAGPVRARPVAVPATLDEVRAWLESAAIRPPPARARPAAGARPAEPAERRVLPGCGEAGAPSRELPLSPYLACEIGCVYCDACARARGGHPAGEGEPGLEGPAVVRREMERLEREGGAGQTILLGSTADPYPPLEGSARITRALLEVLAGWDGVRLQVTTRSDLVLRDLDLLQEIGRRGHVRLNVTVTTLDRDLARVLEPRAPIPRRRLQALSRLVAGGVAAGVFATPLLPGITDRPRDLRALVCEAQAAGARWFGADALQLRPGAREGFFGWLEGTHPDLVPCYRRWYRSTRAAAGVDERIVRTVEALRRQYGVPASVPMPPARAVPRQLSLFEPALDGSEPGPWTASGRAAPAAAVKPATRRPAARPATPTSLRGETGAA